MIWKWPYVFIIQLFFRNPGFPSAATSLSTCNYNVQKSESGNNFYKSFWYISSDVRYHPQRIPNLFGHFLAYLLIYPFISDFFHCNDSFSIARSDFWKLTHQGGIQKLRWPFFALFWPPTSLQLTCLLNRLI